MTTNTASEWPTDETLVAFADGHLESNQMERVARFLQDNEEARHFVELLMVSGDLAKVAYDDAMSGPSSDGLSKLIMGCGTLNDDQKNNVVALAQHAPRARAVGSYALPMAAALALVIGGMAGYEFGQRGTTAQSVPFNVAVGLVSQGSPVEALLERKPSGEPLAISGMPNTGERQLMIISTFRDGSNRVCREFEVLATGETAVPVTAAVACRHNDGNWQIEGAAQVAAALPGSDISFSPAGSDAASAIEGILKALGAQPALSKEDEAALLKGR